MIIKLGISKPTLMHSRWVLYKETTSKSHGEPPTFQNKIHPKPPKITYLSTTRTTHKNLLVPLWTPQKHTQSMNLAPRKNASCRLERRLFGLRLCGTNNVVGNVIMPTTKGNQSMGFIQEAPFIFCPKDSLFPLFTITFLMLKSM